MKLIPRDSEVLLSENPSEQPTDPVGDVARFVARRLIEELPDLIHEILESLPRVLWSVASAVLHHSPPFSTLLSLEYRVLTPLLTPRTTRRVTPVPSTSWMAGSRSATLATQIGGCDQIPLSVTERYSPAGSNTAQRTPSG